MAASKRRKPTRRELVIDRLLVEARELLALASMVNAGEVKDIRELDKEYLPHRIEGLRRLCDFEESDG